LLLRPRPVLPARRHPTFLSGAIMHKLVPATLALAMGLPFGAVADTPADVAALRQEMDAMRAAYEARLQALEQRLRRAEAALATPVVAAAAVAASAPAAPVVAAGSGAAPPAEVVATAPPPSPVTTAVGATGAVGATAETAATGATGGASAFNPALSLILSGLYTHTSLDPVNYALTGFQLPAGGEFGPGTRGFSLAESELGFAASIDPWFRGAANIAIGADNSVSVEEAYVQTTSLGNGLSLKAGRFFSNIGYLNPQHAHTWDFVDNPLAYQAFLGTQYGDDGLQLSWLAPTDQYLELGVEAGRGRNFPGTDTGRNGPGMVALTAHTGGDVGESHSWRAGVSMLNAKATDQLLVASNAAGDPVSDSFNGNTRVWVADAVWKWAPNGNATRTSFKLQGEYLQSTRSGSLVYDVGNADSAGSYRAVQSGWYVQGIYKFHPYWRVGLRTEQLDPGTPDYGLNAGAFAASGYRPRKTSVMLDFSPSEFSRLRLQVADDRSREGLSDRQVFLQYQMSLGAHGAHGY
jgi:hypothetical protein